MCNHLPAAETPNWNDHFTNLLNYQILKSNSHNNYKHLMDFPERRPAIVSLQEKIFTLFIHLGRTRNQQERKEIEAQLVTDLKQLSKLESYLKIESLKLQQQKFLQLLKETQELKGYKEQELNRTKIAYEEKVKQLENSKNQVEKLKDTLQQLFELDQQIEATKQSKKHLQVLNSHKQDNEANLQNQKLSIQQLKQDKEQFIKTLKELILKKQNSNGILDEQIAQEQDLIKELMQKKNECEVELVESEEKKLEEMTRMLRSSRSELSTGRSLKSTSLREEPKREVDGSEMGERKSRKSIHVVKIKQSLSRKAMRYGPWIVLEIGLGLWMYWG